jgi:hypothetical protein
VLKIRFWEGGQGPGEKLDTANAGGPHQLYTFRCGLEANAAGVFGSVTPNQAGTLEARDDAAHCGWTDLLDCGERAQGSWASEDEHGKGGELSGADAAGDVANAEAAQEMDGSGVQLVGNGESFRGEGGRLIDFRLELFVLDRGHGI